MCGTGKPLNHCNPCAALLSYINCLVKVFLKSIRRIEASETVDVTNPAFCAASQNGQGRLVQDISALNVQNVFFYLLKLYVCPKK